MAFTSSDGVWFAVQTKRAQEQRARDNLSSAGIDNFLPLLEPDGAGTPLARRRHEPLFPSYLFVRCDQPSTAHRVRYTRGVARLIGTSAGPLAIDNDLITAIRNRVDERGFVQMSPALKRGDPVRVTAGPLRDFLGVFASHANAAHRVTLLLKTVAGQVRLTLDIDAVARVQ